VSAVRKHDKDTEKAKEKLTEFCTLTMQGYQDLLVLEPFAAAPLALQHGICIPTDSVSLSLTMNSLSQKSITATVANTLVQTVFNQVRKDYAALYYSDEMVTDAIFYAGEVTPEPTKFSHQLLVSCKNNLRRAIDDNHGDVKGCSSLQHDVRKALSDLTRVYGEPGMLRFNRLRGDPMVKGKNFSALFGFETLDAVEAYANLVEELVPWNTCQLDTGKRRVDRLTKQHCAATSTGNPDVVAPEASGGTGNVPEASEATATTTGNPVVASEASGATGNVPEASEATATWTGNPVVASEASGGTGNVPEASEAAGDVPDGASQKDTGDVPDASECTGDPGFTAHKNAYAPRMSTRALSAIDYILLGIFMLRTGVHQQVAALLFGVDQSAVSRAFEAFVRRAFTYVQRHDGILKALLRRKMLRKRKRARGTDPDLPDHHWAFRYVSIIDGTEIYSQTPSDKALQRALWSEYKHHST